MEVHCLQNIKNNKLTILLTIQINLVWLFSLWYFYLFGIFWSYLWILFFSIFLIINVKNTITFNMQFFLLFLCLKSFIINDNDK